MRVDHSHNWQIGREAFEWLPLSPYGPLRATAATEWPMAVRTCCAGKAGGLPAGPPAERLEAGAQVELQAARRQLIGGLTERTVGHARVDT